MTASSVPVLKDKELASPALVESSTVNSITDFITSDSSEKVLDSIEKEEVFVNTFICHLIFYIIFCFSLALHILIDLGLGAFIKNKFVQLFGLRAETVFMKSPVFA